MNQPLGVAPIRSHSTPAATASECTDPDPDASRPAPSPRLRPDALVVALRPTTPETEVNANVTLTQRSSGVEVTVQARLDIPGAYAVYIDEPEACRVSESVVNETGPASGQAPLTVRSKPPPAGATLYPLRVEPNTTSRTQFLVTGADLGACDPESLIGHSLVLVRRVELGSRMPGDVYFTVACVEIRR
jgi:hypothetical protein